METSDPREEHPAACAGEVHATTHKDKINVGTSQAKLRSTEIVQPSLRSWSPSVKSPVSPRLHGCGLGGGSGHYAGTRGFSLAGLCAFPRWFCVAWTSRAACSILADRQLLPPKKGSCNNHRPHHPCHSSFGRAAETPRGQRRHGERASSKKSAWRNLWPEHTFPIHLHLMPLIFQQLQCQGQTEILHPLFHSEMSVTDLWCCFFFFFKHWRMKNKNEKNR